MKKANRRTNSKASPRDNFTRFMETRGLKPHPWATKAGIRSSTLYNFLAGTSASLSSDTLQRLATAAGATVDELLNGAAPAKKAAPATAPVEAVIGIFGRLFPVTEVDDVPLPAGLPAGVAVTAARVDGDGLHPIPAGWVVFYEQEPRDASGLIGKLAIVSVRGQPQRMVRQVQKGSTAGLFTLLAWGSGPMADVEVVEAHAVLSIAQAL